MFEYGQRYQVPVDADGAEFVEEGMRDRLVSTIRVETRAGRSVEGTYEYVRDGAVHIEVDGLTEELESIPGAQIASVALVDTDGPLDRSDEVRG